MARQEKLSRQQELSERPLRRTPRLRRPDPVFSVRDQDTLQALAHPIRVQVLEALREPASAATVARRIGLTRQKVNYHLKELERAGLVQQVGERRVGNFVESMYRAVARTFLVSPQVAWAGDLRGETLRSQHSLQTLVLLGERLQQDAAALLDRAAFDGAQVPSASVVAEARFNTEEDREAFFTEYVQAATRLLEQYGNKEGAPYRVVLAAYPDTEDEHDAQDEPRPTGPDQEGA